MRARKHWIAASLVVSMVAATASGSPDGPIPSVTGAPGEGLCTDCHGGAEVNSGGSIALVDAPLFYRAGSKYTVTLRVTSTQTASFSGRVWGFQLTALNANGIGTGTFATVPGQGTILVSGEGGFSTRRYVEQNAQGQRDGSASPVEWQFDWTAPLSGDGGITFYASALAGDGDGSESGDWTYAGSFASQDTTTPAAPSSWGHVKSAYR